MSEVFILGWYPGFGVMEFRFWNVGSLPSGKASCIPTELLLLQNEKKTVIPQTIFSSQCTTTYTGVTSWAGSERSCLWAA